MTLCPRCRGPLYEGQDYAGRYRSCLNCGFLAALDGRDPDRKRSPPARNHPPHTAPYHREVTRLRPYQAQPARAVLADVRAARGSTFTVMMSRQAGKNELSAWLEKVLLPLHIASGGTGVKCAPTFRPQLLTSIERLRKHLTDAGYGKRIHAVEGFKLGAGKALRTFLRARLGTNTG